MTITEITPDYSVAPQVEPGDAAEIAALGFRAILCNRPDGEAADQPLAGSVGAEAERHGLAFAFVPVVSGQIGPRGDVAGVPGRDRRPAGAGARPIVGRVPVAGPSGRLRRAERVVPTWKFGPIGLGYSRTRGPERVG